MFVLRDPRLTKGGHPISEDAFLLRTRGPRSTLGWGGAGLPGGRGSKECLPVCRGTGEKSQSIVYCVVRRLSARPRSGPLTLAVMTLDSLHTFDFS